MKKIGLILAGILAVAIAVPVLAQVTMTFTTADAAAPIADNTGAVGTCQTITVAGMPTVITDVTVEITAAHSWVGDLTFRVDPPNGGNLMLLNRPGRTGSGAGESDDMSGATPITYDDAAASGISAESMGVGCTGIVGAGCGPDNYIPAPDAADTPIAGEGTNFAQLNGVDPNGVWTLCAGDSAGGDTGTLTSWSVTVTATPVELESFSIE